MIAGPRMTGRRWRRLALFAVFLVVFAPLGLVQRGSGHGEQDDASRGPRYVAGQLGEFVNPLRVPPLLAPRRDRAGRKVFRLTVRAGTRTFLAGTRTETWGVNGAYLGPTLRASRGDRVRIEVTNRLPVPTTMHWHGMHLPAVDDGGPHQTIEPGATWSPAWRIEQPAATLWYHPHPDGETADQVYRGVAGMFILDDAASARLALPKTYGVDDIPVIIQDKRFHADGSLDFSSHRISPTGFLGDRILVNGTLEPHLGVTRERVRLRLLDASNARVYNVGFSDGRSFELVATDQGLLDAPRSLRRIQLSPGERAEIVVSLRRRERVVLRSFPPHLGTNFFLDPLTGGEDSFDLLQLRAARTLAPAPPVPRRLAPPALSRVLPAARTRTFELGEELTINGEKMDMGRIDEVVSAGSSERWEVENHSPLPHNFHVHGVGFRVTEYAGGPPPPALSGPKDTVYVPPHESVRLLVHFGDYADPAHPYMYHCHLLAHEDHGMMGQFVLVRRGSRPRSPARVAAAAVLRHGPYRVDVRIGDGARGFSVRVSRAGAPVSGAQVVASVSMPGMEMPSRPLRLVEAFYGRYSGSAASFGMLGRWLVRVTIRPPGRRTFELRLPVRLHGP